MTRIIVRTSDRPPEGGCLSRGDSLTLSRLLRVAAATLCFTGILAASVWAQADPPPRTDPGSPPVCPGGTDDGWMVLNVPNLPPNSLLGDVWAAPNGDVYVWATYPPRRGGSGNVVDDTPEGERLPTGEPASQPRSSKLYRFDGLRWTMMLSTPGETGVALMGTDPANLFASTTTAAGAAQLYRFDGRTWTREAMPGYYLGRLHTMAGVPGDTYFRIDRVVLRHDGTSLQPVYELPGDVAPVRGLVYLDPGHLVVLRPDGFALRENGVWKTVLSGFQFPDVEDAWGMRDAQGALQMYAGGSNLQDNGIRLWRFTEDDPVTHAGTWRTVLADPPVAGFPDIGTSYHLWGAVGNEVYASGVVEGVGHLLRYDGISWEHLIPPFTLGAVHGVWGTQQGLAWFSTDDGRLIRYQRANRAPDVTHAMPSADRLWPADGGLVPVDILGIVDPEGDAMTVAVTGVTSDEDPITPGLSSACPDAVVSGARVFLRAEHAAGGDGRTYDIEFTATDRLGASSMGHVEVCAPHSVAAPCVTDPETFDALGPCAAPAPAPSALQAQEIGGGLRIRYELPQATRIHLGVYDLAGRLTATVEEGVQTSGAHETTWNLGDLHPGIYFVKLRAGGPAFTRRVVVLR